MTSLGRQFGWLWAAFAVSTFGTCLAFEAYPLIAIIVLHSGPIDVSALAAVGRAVGAVMAVLLGPWIEFHSKRHVMIAMDLVRFAAVMSIPAAFAFGWLSFTQLLIVSMIGAAADIAFRAASGAYLKSIVPPKDLLVANGRFESTTWTAISVGPPLGGAAMSIFGPVTTVVVDAVTYVLSAIGIGLIRGKDLAPVRANTARLRVGDLVEGWRYILAQPTLRPLFFNTTLVNGLIMATSPLVAVLMLGHLGFKPWQYGLAFGIPCIGGLIGSRLAGSLVTRFGQHRVLFTTGMLRACWSIGLAFIHPGIAGIMLVIVVQSGLVTCAGIFNPVLATYRLDRTDSIRIARTLSAWSVTSNAAIAAMTALWGLLAAVTGPRAAIAIAGVFLLATPLLLPRRGHALRREMEAAPNRA